MTLLQAFLLGILQGLTEFIPVSSTAHLLIGQTLLGLPANATMFSFLVIVQLGTLLSLFAFYWKDLLEILTTTWQNLSGLRHFTALPPSAKLGWYIIIATLPALLAGYLLKDAVEALFQQPVLQAGIRLWAAAALLSLAERFSRKERPLAAMNWLDALVVGLFQVVAVFPGASRSGSTISGGLLRGFERPAAARFAFLMSVPVMLAAGGYELLEVVRMPNLAAVLAPLLVGFVSAAVVGWFAIRWLIAYLSQRSLYAFAVYCALVGSLALIVHFL